jgi:hypothetical protein
MEKYATSTRIANTATAIRRRRLYPPYSLVGMYRIADYYGRFVCYAALISLTLIPFRLNGKTVGPEPADSSSSLDTGANLYRMESDGRYRYNPVCKADGKDRR